MGKENIKNLEELIQKYTGPSKTLIDSEVTKLTAPGENYLGIVLKVEATLKDSNGQQEQFSAVAKCLNFNLIEFIRKTVPTQYKKEKAFYTEIVPTLQHFQKEEKLEESMIQDIFPKLYTFRSSLNEVNEEPDEDAVLLFENLVEQNYSNADRTIGFDLDGTQLILRDLAVFHGLPIALKLRKPDEFENKIKKHLYNPFTINKNEPPPPPPPAIHHNVWLEILDENDEVKPYLELLKDRFKKSHELMMEQMSKKPKEPFASISHTDLWTNNTMQVFKEGKVIKNKFIDFQLYNYESVARDVLFFLWTSVQLSDLLEHHDDLIKLYYRNLVNVLDRYGCDISPFTYENFMQEFNDFGPHVLQHVMFMLIPIFGKKGQAAFDPTEGPKDMKPEVVSAEARIRAVKLICHFGKRGWL